MSFPDQLSPSRSDVTPAPITCHFPAPTSPPLTHVPRSASCCTRGRLPSCSGQLFLEHNLWTPLQGRANPAFLTSKTQPSFSQAVPLPCRGLSLATTPGTAAVIPKRGLSLPLSPLPPTPTSTDIHCLTQTELAKHLLDLNSIHLDCFLRSCLSQITIYSEQMVEAGGLRESKILSPGRWRCQPEDIRTEGKK